MKGTWEKNGRGRGRGGIAGRREVSMSAQKKLMELLHNAVTRRKHTHRKMLYVSVDWQIKCVNSAPSPIVSCVNCTLHTATLKLVSTAV